MRTKAIVILSFSCYGIHKVLLFGSLRVLCKNFVSILKPALEATGFLFVVKG